jgi:predicted short-subunit dehydrogenase-like oxidoreductase (DUF2520 family)
VVLFLLRSIVTNMKPSFAIIGCGKVGLSLGKQLIKKGCRPAGVASKSLSTAKKAAGLLKTNNFSIRPWEVISNADVVFITTPDSVIERTCRQIVKNKGFHKGAVVLHCSGALSSEVLNSAQSSGVYVGSMHPLQSFASVEPGTNPFKDIIISIEGDREAVSVARQISLLMNATAVQIRTEAKVLYHASAVVASNYLVTLMDLAVSLLKTAGVADKQAQQMLMPLVDGTVANIKRVGVPAALTGPIERGDAVTIRRHVAALKEGAPDILALYQVLGGRTIEVAQKKGSFKQQDSIKKLKQALGIR